ncbi:MAG: NAD(+)/NADH kinase [Acidobacteria bacterium]|nr:NAD(+)/NADH kinase [Acidobacteriota bacterium]
MMAPVTRAGLIARLKPEALSALADAAEWLHEHGCTPVVEADSAEATGLGARWRTAPRTSLAAGVDVILTFGGDGTLLDAANAVVHGDGDAPLVGINFGRLGFLTEVDRSEMTGALEQLLAGGTRLETRAMIHGRLLRGDTVVCDRIALNDIVVTRSALSRMVEITVDVDGQFVCRVKADGLIVSTATGSTAYNLSGGGPIVHPSVDAVVLTPIAPHTLTLRPLVLPAAARIEMRPVMDPQTEMVATFDGQFGVRMEPTDVMHITRATRVLHLARTSSRTYFGMLREKLKWAHT